MRVHDGSRRWICWPDPDEVCIEGGCMRCTGSGGGHKIMTLAEVRTYANAVGLPAEEDHLRQGVMIRAVAQDDDGWGTVTAWSS